MITTKMVVMINGLKILILLMMMIHRTKTKRIMFKMFVL